MCNNWLYHVLGIHQGDCAEVTSFAFKGLEVDISGSLDLYDRLKNEIESYFQDDEPVVSNVIPIYVWRIVPWNFAVHAPTTGLAIKLYKKLP
jgi:hypothetical protein